MYYQHHNQYKRKNKKQHKMSVIAKDQNIIKATRFFKNSKKKKKYSKVMKKNHPHYKTFLIYKLLVQISKKSLSQWVCLLHPTLVGLLVCMYGCLFVFQSNDPQVNSPSFCLALVVAAPVLFQQECYLSLQSGYLVFMIRNFQMKLFIFQFQLSYPLVHVMQLLVLLHLDADRVS